MSAWGVAWGTAWRAAWGALVIVPGAADLRARVCVRDRALNQVVTHDVCGGD